LDADQCDGRAGKFNLGTQFIARAGDAANGFYQLQFGVDVEREIGGVTAGVGYSYVPSYEDGELTTQGAQDQAAGERAGRASRPGRSGCAIAPGAEVARRW
jgi:hypothetical protein